MCAWQPQIAILHVPDLAMRAVQSKAAPHLESGLGILEVLWNVVVLWQATARERVHLLYQPLLSCRVGCQLIQDS